MFHTRALVVPSGVASNVWKWENVGQTANTCWYLNNLIQNPLVAFPRDCNNPRTSGITLDPLLSSVSNYWWNNTYLGAVNYYHSHLPNLSNIFDLLHSLMRKGISWRAFKETKKMLCSAHFLTHFDPYMPILEQVDASHYGLGAVMAHAMDDGSEKPVCYISRTLFDVQWNYTHNEKEGLALVFAVKKLHQCWYGNSCTIFTDHFWDCLQNKKPFLQNAWLSS